MHSPENVRLGRLAHGVLLVIGQEDHVLASVTKVLVQVCRHILDVVDTSTQLTLLAEIVDSNEQRLSLACATRVLEVIALRGTVAEGDWVTGRGLGARAALIGIRYRGMLIDVDKCDVENSTEWGDKPGGRP